MIILDKNTIERWIGCQEQFCHDFMKYSFACHHAVGADIDLVASEIEAAHGEWVTIVHDWQAKRFRHETESLSYTKIMAILLHCLSRRSFVGDMREYVPFRHPQPEFPGTEDERQQLLADLLGAPEAVTALQFCLAVLNFFESRRIDRRTPFEFRMTEAGRHDLLMMLTSEEQGPMPVYLILEAFYSRD